jgi:hypothetical protein
MGHTACRFLMNLSVQGFNQHSSSYRKLLLCCFAVLFSSAHLEQVILAADEASAARWGALDDVVMVSWQDTWEKENLYSLVTWF